jgi:hypothetical protein
MSAIRRLLSGISTSAMWAARYEVSAPIRQKPMAPVEPVRRGFSDQSDFQSALEAERSPLAAHAPNLAGSSRREREALAVYSGRSDFQSFLPRYQHLLGVNMPPPPTPYSPPARFQQMAAAPAAAEQAPRESGTRPGLTATADLEKAFEKVAEDDSVRLYTAQDAEGGRSIIQHPDGSVTDPKAPESRFEDVAAWERANPGLTHAASLSRNDLELVLSMPEGASRDEVLAELASADAFSGLDASDAAGDDFMPSLEDLPVNAEPEAEAASADDFMPSLEDLPSGGEPVEALPEESAGAPPLSPEELDALLLPTGELAEGQQPLDVAVQVAQRGTSEQQSRVATALYERSQTPGLGEAPAYQHGAALAASSSPEATQALLQHVGEARMADFVRTVLQA